MKISEDIKKALGEELSKLVEAVESTVELGITNNGTLVPADKHEGLKRDLSTAKQELEAVNTQLGETSKKIDELSKVSSTAEETKAELEKFKLEHETFKTDSEKRLINVNKRFAVESLLREEKVLPEAIDLLTSQFKLDEIVLDDSGKIVDKDKHLNPIKESRKGLFGEIVTNTDDKKGGTDKPNEEDMSDEEYFNNIGLKDFRL